MPIPDNEHTQAAFYDPFANDHEQVTTDRTYSNADPDIAALIKGLDNLPYTEETGAVAFDPFADDEDENDQDYAQQIGNRAREEALSTFRQRRGTSRSARPVANGMVSLPFIPLIPEDLALKNPTDNSEVEPPILHPGDIVAEQYEIVGVIAHGGMGWIYLGTDRNVSGRMVVLKGMIDKNNSHDYGAAEAEREFLADITHPGIVKSYNFIDDPRIPGGLIVMEYVPGPSLRALKKQQETGRFAIDIAIGYILEVLPALDYLHSRGVVYNDLKPDNIIATENQVKLIDLGAVSGIGAYGFIYGTKGFQAPEVATHGPSVASDIYTVGRTLAALTIHLPVENGAYSTKLPTPDEEPLFAQYVSFHRLLRRATEEDPHKRFSSIKELETQLYGVLREFLAVRDGKQFPAQYSLFSPQRSTYGTKHAVFHTDQLLDGIERSVKMTPTEIITALPVPLLDRDDPGAVLISGFSYTEPSEALETMRQAMTQDKFRDSKEIPLGVVRSLIDLGFTDEARSWLDTLEPQLGSDWRYQWYAGITALLLEDYLSAQANFNQVFSVLPGESAPKLARAAVSELILQQLGLADKPQLSPDAAIAAVRLDFHSPGGMWNHLSTEPETLRYKGIYLYSLIWATNPATVSSAFGLARMLMAENQVELAVQALDQVPQSSRHHRMAQLTAILHLLSQDLTESRIRRAARRLEKIPTNEPRFQQIRIAVLNAGLTWLHETGLPAAAASGGLFGFAFTRDGLRTGLYESLRSLARATPHPFHRYQLVDMANQVRPTTWF
ncbi:MULTISPECIES: serine/threonine protein kinase [unclassified Corynebacterium]|uniref:serine/threonine protein kinase n=1 Tax=unclassified Corynebacterium TaxID=2624378 RepID=UPI00163D892C|nr:MULTISPECIES: serine/threonine protein kinase [unclassified Corynebacterium]